MNYRNLLIYIIQKIRQLSGRNMLKSIIFLKIYGYIRNINLKRKKIIWIDEIKESKTHIKSKESIIIYSPIIFGETEKIIHEKTPNSYLYILNNVYSSITSSSFYNSKYIFIERMENVPKNVGNYCTGHLIKHNNKKSIIQIYNDKTIIKSPTLFLGGNGSSNYFHWVIEILSKLLILEKEVFEKLNIQTITVNKKALEIQSFQDSLKIILDYKNIKSEILYIEEDKEIFFEQIIYITSFNSVLFNSNLLKEHITFFQKTYYSKDILHNFRNIVLNSIQFKNFLLNIYGEDRFPKKIFLIRGKVSSYNKREYNEKEIFNYFKEYDFKEICIDEYSFLEQVYLFNNACFIAGPSGAVWTNIIFAKKDSYSVSWLPKKFFNFSGFSALAKIFSINMYFLEATSIDNNLHGKYNLDKNKVKDFLFNIYLKDGVKNEQ